MELSKIVLFQGISEEEAQQMMQCLQACRKSFQKGEVICRAGDRVSGVGAVLKGSVLIERDDIWGRRTLLDRVEAGQIFAETYACIPGERLMVNAVAEEETQILFVNVERMMRRCPNSCPHHERLIRNLLEICARKNLLLSRRILHTSPKTIRERLLSYFSWMAETKESREFALPFNRQQLADYLNVDRSALSNELSKMQKDGLLTVKKSRIILQDSSRPHEKILRPQPADRRK